MEDSLRYPIGKCPRPKEISNETLNEWTKVIKGFPSHLKAVVKDLSNQELDIPYRKDGWTVRQLVHHLADSHMNAYLRFKLALTEKRPTIKPYEQDLWAKQPDYEGSIDPSLEILEGVHNRWAKLLESMTPKDFEQTYIHPEYNDEYDLKESLCQYEWHCRHHLAHIELAKKQTL
ncbi:MAG: putative metal-dependent hydrolase [Cyclobacteriaceae bacterium]|nr:putative metal-dependent hydrolase [Cyclobacteriaceae bacterium]